MGFSIWQILIILLIVILLFGTKKLRNMGGDLGAAVKGFKKGMDDDDKQKENEKEKQADQKLTQDEQKGETIEGEAQHEKDKTK